jgi:hypothetical protein
MRDIEKEYEKAEYLADEARESWFFVDGIADVHKMFADMNANYARAGMALINLQDPEYTWPIIAVAYNLHRGSAMRVAECLAKYDKNH